MFGFNEVVGHEAIKQRIKQNVLNGRMPHALMFTGPSGVGKLPMYWHWQDICPVRTVLLKMLVEHVRRAESGKSLPIRMYILFSHS